MRVQHVLVAIDGSEFSAHALEVASRLATALNGHIGLVHVIERKFVGSETGVPCDQLWAMVRADAKALLDAAATSIPAHPHPWKFLRVGTPWKEIVKSACEWPADLIVVGTHGRTGVNRLLFGSTAEHVLRHAQRPVVVVPLTSATIEVP